MYIQFFSFQAYIFSKISIFSHNFRNILGSEARSLLDNPLCENVNIFFKKVKGNQMSILATELLLVPCPFVLKSQKLRSFFLTPLFFHTIFCKMCFENFERHPTIFDQKNGKTENRHCRMKVCTLKIHQIKGAILTPLSSV